MTCSVPLLDYSVMSVTRINDEALRGWCQELVAAGRAKGTIEVRLSHVRRCLDGVGKPVGDVTRRDLVEWMAAGEWSASTRRGVRASLRLFFRWYAVEHGAESIAEELPTVPVPRAVPRPAADFAVMAAMRRADDWVALAIEIMATCGLRRAECARVRVDDVQPVGQGWMIRVVGKGGHVRVVPCPPSLALRIRARGGGWLFPGGQDGHVSPGWLGKKVSAVMGEGLTAHTLRHRYASVAYSHSHDLRGVQELLGHASVATTQVYTAVDEQSVRDVARGAWRIAC